MANKIDHVSIIITVYNEMDNIKPLLTEINEAYQDKITYEIVLVDDGSTDGTVQKIQEMQSKMPQLKLIRHASNYGKSAAIITGVGHAKYNWIGTMDGDMQNDPQDILTFIHVYRTANKNGNVLIAGHRTKRNDNWLRRFSSHTANKIRGKLLKDDCPDTACGLKLFQRDLFMRLPHFNHIHRFLPALFKQYGAEIINVEANHRHRMHGVSKYGISNRLWVGIMDLFGVMWLRARYCDPKTLD